MQSKLFRVVQVGMSYYSVQRDRSTLPNDQFAIVISLMNFLRARGLVDTMDCCDLPVGYSKSQKLKRNEGQYRRVKQKVSSSYLHTHTSLSIGKQTRRNCLVA